MDHQFLIRKHGNKVAAHIWTGDDTLCRLCSTNPRFVKSKYVVTKNTYGCNVCHMCNEVSKKREPQSKNEGERASYD